MKLIHSLIFSSVFKLFQRDYKKLFLTFLSLFIGALVLTSVLSITGTIRDFLFSESKTLIGGDLVISQNFPIDYQKSAILKKLIKNDDIISEKFQTTTNIFNEKETSSLLVSIKAVSETYPLYGTIETLSGRKTLPAKDEIFAEKAFFERFNIKVGDKVKINGKKFRVSEEVTKEPDNFTNGFSFGPKILIGFDGWKRTEINKEASRISYFFSLKTSDSKKLKNLLPEIENEFKTKGAQITTSEKGPTQLLNILETWERFFLTITILTLFLIIVNIRSNLTYLLNYFTRTIAVFRVLGMRKNDILFIFVLILMIISFFSAIFGNFTGNILVTGILPYLNEFLGTNLPAPALYKSMALIIIFNIFLCLLASISTLLKILEIEPKAILSQTMETTSRFSTLKRELLISGFIGIGLFLGILVLVENLKISIISVIALMVVFVLFLLLVKLILFTLYKNRFRFSFFYRSIISFVKNQGMVSEVAIVSLTMALSSVFSIGLLQNNLEQTLQNNLRNEIPNLYFIDVFPEQRKELKKVLNKDIKIFSNVRGRFISVDKNNIALNKDTPNELKREFNLTYRSELIEGEKIISGTWHGKNNKNSVSVEEKFAERAGITLGSQVGFSVMGIPVTAKVTSFRTVKSDNGLPFFFLVFSPDVLQFAPQTYFGYTYISEARIPKIQNRIAKIFPNIIVLPTGEIFKTVQKITGSIINSILAVSIPSLILGLILIISMIINSARERFKDLLLFKVFGAVKNTIFKLYIIENIFLLLFSSTFAAIFSFSFTYILTHYFFKFEVFYFQSNIFSVIILLLVILISFSFYLMQKMFRNTSSELFRN